jgi:hypothetical protein
MNHFQASICFDSGRICLLLMRCLTARMGNDLFSGSIVNFKNGSSEHENAWMLFALNTCYPEAMRLSIFHMAILSFSMDMEMRGILKLNVQPKPSMLSTHILPPWSLMILEEMYKPIPKPLYFLLTCSTR